jgi:hypothetical protein
MLRKSKNTLIFVYGITYKDHKNMRKLFKTFFVSFISLSS